MSAREREKERLALAGYDFAKKFIEKVLKDIDEPYRIRKAVLRSTQEEIVSAIEHNGNRIDVGIEAWIRERGTG